MNAPKVAICMPYHRFVDGPTAMCAMQLGFHAARWVSALVIQSTGCYVEDNRNGAVEFALQTGIDFDWFMWIDADMEFPPDTLTRLIAHNRDIVGANYRVRTPPYSFCAHYADGSDAHIHEPGLHPMGHLPTGLLLTRFE